MSGNLSPSLASPVLGKSNLFHCRGCSQDTSCSTATRSGMRNPENLGTRPNFFSGCQVLLRKTVWISYRISSVQHCPTIAPPKPTKKNRPIKGSVRTSLLLLQIWSLGCFTKRSLDYKIAIGMLWTGNLHDTVERYCATSSC